jgi:dolichyl-phosphate-mannose--protein O-mannosyl transferase
MNIRNITRIIVGTGVILLIPLLAMLVTDEVNWDWLDFAVIGTLLIGAGLIYEFVMAKVNNKYRSIVIAVIIAIVFLIWAELAVGIFGTPISGQ